MYYPQQSPGISHKLANHHDNSPWRLPILVQQQQSQQSSVGPPPPSPGYALYTNGLQHHPGHHPLNHPPIQHHHQNSIPHYPSPPNPHAHQQHILAQGSPATPVTTPHWQQQLMKCEMIRSSRTPHHRARASAMASRTVAKSAIPITNPNLIKPQTPAIELNGKDSESPDSSPSSAAAVNHPSSTVAPVAEAPRLTAISPPENTWNTLDMGGLSIKNIPPSSGLFSFTFLINLYLNHNSLSSIPHEISNLRHLKLLDLSGNGLSTVPPELGMLTQLKELYLFDNHLTTIPPQFGTLHQLRTLGIEGNPLDASLKTIIQKEGTTALISFLRDSCPVDNPPPPRVWKDLLNERDIVSQDAETFSVLSYNILCEKYATERLYGYTPSWALAWSYRKELILTEVTNYSADFLCLQEVDIAQFEDYFTKNLGEEGYDGIYWPKSRYKTMSEADRRQVDGCAIFYNRNKYKLVEKYLIEFSAVAMQRQDFKKTDDMFNRVLGKDHIAVVCLMENLNTGTRFVIANAHIHWDTTYRDVKLVQVALLLEEVEKIANGFAKYPPPKPAADGELLTPSELSMSTSSNADESKDSSLEAVNAVSEGSEPTIDPDNQQPPPNFSQSSQPYRPPPTYTDGTKIPLIICGDFNSMPGSGVYEFLSTGSAPPDHPDFMSHVYGRYTSEGIRHRFGLKNSYAAPGAGELPLTNHTPSFRGAIDHIWYSAANVAVTSVLGEVDRGYLEKVVGFPNAHFPSDHVCIMAKFRVKPPRDIAASRPTPTAVFHNRS